MKRSRFSIVAVGKPRNAHIAGAIQEYETRAARYWPLDVREVREVSGRSQTPEQVLKQEGERLLQGITDKALMVACDPEGTIMRSEEFAQWLQRERERSTRDVAFVIGGAHGLAMSVRERAEIFLSFGRWTLPHELARLVLAEQLYRAGTIVRGEPYQK